MDIELPDWLDASFLATALQDGDEGVPPVTVTKFSAALAVAAGSNFMSRLYRIKIYYVIGKEENCISLIIKAPFTKGMVNELIEQCDFYGKEPKVYTQLLPILNSMVNSEIGPKSYPNFVNNAMVLTDLKELGFEMCDRYKQLDYPHCVQVFRSLAKFHAASVACKRDYPHIVDLVGQESIYTKNKRFETDVRPWIEQSLKSVLGTVSDMNLSKEVQDLISCRVETISDSLVSICQPKTTGLNVLNHGDLWVNNILFKHSTSGNVVDVRFIDFQIVRYGSPVLDIIYFIWTSSDEDVRENHLEDLCEIYRSTLNAMLEELGCEERMTKKELFEDMKRAVDWAVNTVCSLLPVIVCEAEDFIDVEQYNPEDFKEGFPDKVLKIYNGRHYRELLPKVMAHLQVWVAFYQ